MSPTQKFPLQLARFDRGARLLFAFVLVFLLVDIVQLVYRYTLPTDGWLVHSNDGNALIWVYDVNLIGAPSGLLPGDIIQAVDSQPVQIAKFLDFVAPPTDWQVGKKVVILVERGDKAVAIPVTVLHWTPWVVWHWNTGDPVQVVNILGSLLTLFVAWLIFLRRPELPSARILLIAGSAGCAPSISAMLPDGLSVLFNRTAFLLSNFFGYVTWVALLAPAILAFTLSFPQPKRVIQRLPWLGLIPFAIGLAELVCFYTLNMRTLNLIGNYVPAILFVVSIFSLVHSGFTQRDPTSRAQLRWVIWGFGVGLALALLSFSTSDPNDPFGVIINTISSLGGVVIGISLGIAVLRYHLFEIDVIIRKTLVYALLTGLLALVYFGSVILLDNLAGAFSGQQHSPVVLVVSTLAIAALFNPLRRGIQVTIDRRFFRRKYDAEQALDSFSLSVRDEVDLDAMTHALLEVVGNTLQPELLGLWLSSTKPDHDRLPESAAENKKTHFLRDENEEGRTG
jgi:hypothetical protein